jgi:hypothetical protein
VLPRPARSDEREPHCKNLPLSSSELKEWVNTPKTALYEGRVADILAELGQRIQQLVPQQANVCTRLTKIQEYLTKRQAKMDYKRLREQDWEISSGAVEGTVNYIIAQRFDSGGCAGSKNARKPCCNFGA